MGESTNPMLPVWPDVAWGSSLLVPLALYALSAVGIVLLVRRVPGVPAWGGVIPLWNLYLLVKMAGFRGTLTILAVVPVVNVVVAAVVVHRIARSTGSGENEALGWAVLCVVLPPLGLVMLGLRAGSYTGPWRPDLSGVPTPAGATD